MLLQTGALLLPGRLELLQEVTVSPRRTASESLAYIDGLRRSAAVHGLIHLVGLGRPNAVLWGTAAALFVAAAAALFLWPRWWRAVGAVNAVVLIGVIGQPQWGPTGLSARFAWHRTALVTGTNRPASMRASS
jgi:hypothetical protein